MARRSRSGMKRRPMRRLGLGVAMASALGLLLFQTAPGISQMFDPARSVASDRLVVSANNSIWSRITGASAKDERIRELEAEVRDLSRWRAAAISMAERIETYEEILNVMGEPPVRGVTARVAAETDGPFAETILANAGRAQGVKDGAIAVNEGGLVGRVTRLGERSSRILLVTDFNSRVPVMGEQSGLRAILYGGRDGLGVLTDMPETGNFLSGERILTSGEGGVFPRGIIAGQALKRDATTRVRFTLSDSRGGFVRLVPRMEIPRPEDDPVIEPPVEAVAEVTPNEGTSAPRLAGQ